MKPPLPPTTMKHVHLMLGHRLRRWSNIKTTLNHTLCLIWFHTERSTKATYCVPMKNQDLAVSVMMSRDTHKTRTALQRRKAITAYLKSNQLLPFGFARPHRRLVRRMKEAGYELFTCDFLLSRWKNSVNGIQRSMRSRSQNIASASYGHKPLICERTLYCNDQ